MEDDPQALTSDKVVASKATVAAPRTRQYRGYTTRNVVTGYAQQSPRPKASPLTYKKEPVIIKQEKKGRGFLSWLFKKG